MPISKAALRTIPTASPKACGCAVETGVAGLSIEDSTGDADNPLYDFDLAVARVRAARAAIDKAGGDVVFTARSEGFIRNRPDLPRRSGGSRPSPKPAPIASMRPASRRRRKSKRSSRRSAEAGQFPDGDGDASSPSTELAALGVRRISVGGTLARVAWTALIRAAREIADEGSFDRLRRHDRRMRSSTRSSATTSTRRKAAELTWRSPSIRRSTRASGRATCVLEGRFGARREARCRRTTAPTSGTPSGIRRRIWTYMTLRPVRRATQSFGRMADERATLDDPYSYAIVDKDGRAVGIATLMEIRPAMRVIEVGHIVYSARLAAHAARDRGAISARALCVRDARLSPLRVEMQCAQCRVAPRGASVSASPSRASSAST